MKLIKQDVGVWVKASDELPNQGQDVLASNKEDNWESQCYLRGNEWYNTWDDDVECFPTQWLKPLKDVYVLTEDELEEFALEFTEHLTDAIVEAKPDSNISSEEIYKQFLESIKKINSFK